MTTENRERALLDIDALSVAFGGVQALRSVSLKVAAGEKVALLGHNGAGKSTLFKAVLGFVRPGEGTITVAGGHPGSTAARLSVAYLPESVAFPKMLTGVEIVTYFAKLKSVKPRAAMPLLDLVGLGDAARRQVGTYSKGMRQRLGLAQALIGKPRLLLLDEPTSGLDPVSRREFYAVIDRVSAAGAAVLLSSHALTEVEGHTDRVAILSKGRLMADGPLKTLAEAAHLPITIRVRASDGHADELHGRLGGARVNGRSVVLSCGPAEKVGLIGRIAELRANIDDIDIALPSLDDIYRFYSAGENAGDVS